MPDIYLRSVPSDSDQDDVRLYDPTIPDAGGGQPAGPEPGQYTGNFYQTPVAGCARIRGRWYWKVV